jgi:hypothetical protein
MASRSKGVTLMSSEAHGTSGYSAGELRDAMSFFGIPGRSDIEALAEFDDFRGDGIETGAENHGMNRGDVNVQAIPNKRCWHCGWPCFSTSRRCRCCGRVLPTVLEGWHQCVPHTWKIPISAQVAQPLPPASMTGDLSHLGYLSDDGLDGDFGFPRFEGDELFSYEISGDPEPLALDELGADVIGEDLFGCDALNCLGIEVFAIDDMPSEFASDHFSGDERCAGEWAESALQSDALGEDDLYSMGWDPFKSIKKAVRPLSKTFKAASKTVKRGIKTAGKVAKRVGKVAGRVPLVKPLARTLRPVTGLARSALRTTGQVYKSAFKLNPVSLLKNPKAALAAQLKAARSVMATAQQTVGVAKQLVKSPIVKTVVGGAAIVFPPVGVPAAAALATAAAVAAAVDSKVPAAAAAAQKVIENTARLAQGGDKGAQIALSEISTQKKALLADRLRRAPLGAKRLVFDVNRQGRILRRSF